MMGKIATLACGFLLLPLALVAAERPVVERLCAGDAYERALCNYEQGRLEEAEAAFRALTEEDPAPRTIRAHYFLARTLMRQGNCEEASRELIWIFGADPGFYREWGCDFLLGACRRRLGLD